MTRKNACVSVYLHIIFPRKKNILNISELDKNVKKYKMPLGFKSTEDSLQRIFRNEYTAALCIISLKIFFLNWWFMNVVSIAEQKYLWPQHVP